MESTPYYTAYFIIVTALICMCYDYNRKETRIHKRYRVHRKS